MGELCRTIAGEKFCIEYPQVNKIIEKARPSIFSFEYPIFSEAYKETLEHKFLRHYYMQEIGLETVGQWKLKLEDKLNLIMPYYNQLYESALLKIEPFNDVDYKRESVTDTNGTGTTNGQTNTTTTSTDVVNSNLTENSTVTSNSENVTNENGKNTADRSSDSKTTGQETSTITNDKTHTNTRTEQKRYSDTPQGGLKGLYDDVYLTSAEVNNSENHDTDKTDEQHKSNTNGTVNTNDSETATTERNYKTTGLQSEVIQKTTSNNTNDQANINTSENSQSNTENKTTANFIEHIYGKTNSKSYSLLLKELRDTFINIDLMVIEELSDLFMSVWE